MDAFIINFVLKNEIFVLPEREKLRHSERRIRRKPRNGSWGEASYTENYIEKIRKSNDYIEEPNEGEKEKERWIFTRQSNMTL